MAKSWDPWIGQHIGATVTSVTTFVYLNRVLEYSVYQKFKTTFEKNSFFYYCVRLIHFLHHSTYSSILLCDCGTMVLFEISKFNFICFLLLRQSDLSYFCDVLAGKMGKKASIVQV